MKKKVYFFNKWISCSLMLFLYFFTQGAWACILEDTYQCEGGIRFAVTRGVLYISGNPVAAKRKEFPNQYEIGSVNFRSAQDGRIVDYKTPQSWLGFMTTLLGPMDNENEVLYKYELDTTIRSGSDGQYIGKCHGEIHVNLFELSGITILIFDNYSSTPPIKTKREIDISFYSSPVRSVFKDVEKPIDASLDILNRLGVHQDGNGEMKSFTELNYIGCWKDLRP